MKKVFYSIAVISAMMFASCTEDRGTTHEVADANQNENVDQSEIRGYGDNQTTAADMDQDPEIVWRQKSERVSGQMATDLQLDPESQKKVEQALYNHEKRLNELEGRYNYSETNRMGGQTDNDTENDMNDNKAIDMDASSETNAGNANMQMTESEIKSEKELIKADMDRELQSILTPEQFRMYQHNRANYDEMKYENEATDTKLKVEGDETKYKSGETKIKSEDDEMKIKTENEKIKVEKKDN